MDNAIAIMRAQGVQVESVRVTDLDVPPGVQPDMTEHDFATDDWPPCNSASSSPTSSSSARRSGSARSRASAPQRAAWDAGAHFDHPNPEYRWQPAGEPAASPASNRP
jgi:hypothetical protein